MYRDKITTLENWKVAKRRKPLILKGARQVGKTWLVRELSKSFESFIEINFERNPHFSTIFEADLDPRRILNEILDATGKTYELDNTLLFLDEAQTTPAAIKSLRYFYEELPELHVICAGSLLDFTMEQISTGVGRLTYLDLYPLTFGEYLVAVGEERLRAKVREQPFHEPLLDIHHQKLLRHLHKYLLTGGMPEVVREYISTGSLRRAQEVQHDLIRTFQDDFSKYAKTHQIRHLDSVLRSIPLQLGTKFVFSQVSDNVRSREISPALDLLQKALIVHKVVHSKADGLPLQARLNPKRFKTILLDIGLTQNLLGVNLEEWITGGIKKHVRGGGIAEAFVGQELAAYTGASSVNPLVYWHRESPSSSAEIDFLVELSGKIVPLEVKEGPSGRMKSLHLFIKEKNISQGIKLSPFGFSIKGYIQTVPLYAVERLFTG